jgi:hypothetical protein
MKKKQKGYTSSGSCKKNQSGEKTNKKRKTHIGLNKNANLTPVQGPSTIVCMIVT